jgi:hypothetical protein
MIAGDEGGNPYLWSLEEVEGGFHCMAWSVTPEESEELRTASGRISMSRSPDQEATCADEEAVQRFFAGSIDTVLSACAEYILQKLKTAAPG